MVEKLNPKEVKQKILIFLETNGPSLPVQVAKHIGLNTIFASAFLSELASEGSVKISDMKVGGSPLYLTLLKKPMLENFSKYLPGKEREAFELLKKNNFLEDELQKPAIRVALRGLKDFAIPIKKQDKIFWMYYLVDEKAMPEIKPEIKIEKIQEIIPKLEETKPKEEEKKLEIEIKTPIKIIKKRRIKKKPTVIDETFLNQIKEYLTRKQIELLKVDEFNKKEITARIKKDNQEYLLSALNKKKVEESDLIKAYKKSSLLNLSYYVLSKGEASKKTKEAIKAYKKLASVDKIETAEQ